jgi:hypothetical protein
MHLIDRIGITTLATLVACAGLYWLSSEAVVAWQLDATGANSRAELGDDLGLGILLLLFCLPTTAVGTVWTALHVWGRTGTRKR